MKQVFCMWGALTLAGVAVLYVLGVFDQSLPAPSSPSVFLGNAHMTLEVNTDSPGYEVKAGQAIAYRCEVVVWPLPPVGDYVPPQRTGLEAWASMSDR